jgi:hypothetical protein
MAREGATEVEFTLILYGVVVANAIYQLTFEVAVRNFMLGFAFLVILGDWIEYQIAKEDTTGSTVEYILMFVLDVVILIVWYFLTIISPADFEWFLAIASVFFFLQALWDFTILNLRSELLWRPALHLGVFFSLLAVIQSAYSFPPQYALIVAFVAFVGRKSPHWYRLLSESPTRI